MTTLSYPKFVESRVKWLPTFAEDIHHACTGIMGEAVEMVYATSIKNTHEELGDMEFYIRHAWLALAKWGKTTTFGYQVRANLDLEDLIIVTAADLLDMSKKVWIYNKPPEKLHFVSALIRLEAVLEGYYNRIDYPRATAQADNMSKLLKRYPSGYSDHSAQARADKKERE